jgi:hypothetical protein
MRSASTLAPAMISCASRSALARLAWYSASSFAASSFRLAGVVQFRLDAFAAMVERLQHVR